MEIEVAEINGTLPFTEMNAAKKLRRIFEIRVNFMKR